MTQDNIIALATPQGIGAIGVIRLSGTDVIKICSQFFYAKGKLKDLTKVQRLHLAFWTYKN